MVDRSVPPQSVGFSPFIIKEVDAITLDNGVPVFYLQSGNQDIVRLELVFSAGSWHEQLKGLSYLSSKMLFEGSSKHTSKEIAECIASYGAFMEIHPGFENVNFTFYLMEKHLGKLLPFISEVIETAIFPDAEFENLKNITIQSLRVNREKNQFVASVEFRNSLFSESHPYGRQYWEEDIQAIQQPAVREFSSRFFSLGNLEIFVSGKYDYKKTTTILNDFFGEKKPFQKEIAQNATVVRSTEKKEKLITKAGAVQSSIRLGCHAISRKDVDYIPFTIMNEVLGGYFGSRLMRNIREEKGYTYGIHSSLNSMRNGSYLVIATDVKIENTRQTLDEISLEILKLQSEKIPQNELETVKSYMLGRFMNSMNSPFALMDKFKTLHYNGLDYSFYNNYVNEIQKVGVEEVQIQAQKHLGDEKLVQVVVGGLNDL